MDVKEGGGVVGKILHASQVAHQAGAFPYFSSMKTLGAFLHPWTSAMN